MDAPGEMQPYAREEELQMWAHAGERIPKYVWITCVHD